MVLRCEALAQHLQLALLTRGEDVLLQRLTLLIRHHHIDGAVLIAYVVKDADVGVFERGDGACFAFEAQA